MDHVVLDCPRMIVKLERMNMEQVDPEKGQKTKTLVEPREELETVKMKENPK
jgi:hypothetical protein